MDVNTGVLRGVLERDVKDKSFWIRDDVSVKGGDNVICFMFVSVCLRLIRRRILGRELCFDDDDDGDDDDTMVLDVLLLLIFDVIDRLI